MMIKTLVPSCVVTYPLLHNEVADWCKENNIRHTYMGRYHNNEIWYIENPDERTLFVLRWREHG